MVVILSGHWGTIQHAPQNSPSEGLKRGALAYQLPRVMCHQFPPIPRLYMWSSHCSIGETLKQWPKEARNSRDKVLAGDTWTRLLLSQWLELGVELRGFEEGARDDPLRRLVREGFSVEVASRLRPREKRTRTAKTGRRVFSGTGKSMLEGPAKELALLRNWKIRVAMVSKWEEGSPRC